MAEEQKQLELEVFTVPQEAIDADALEQQGVEIYSVDKAALPELTKEPEKPIEGMGERAVAGVKRSYFNLEAAADASDATVFHEQAQRARRSLAYGRNALGIPYDEEQKAALQAEIDQNTRWYIESVADGIKNQAKAAAQPMSQVRADLAAVGAQGEGFIEQLGQLKEAVEQDPLGLLADLTAENSLQLTSMIVGVAAARSAGAGRAGEIGVGFESSRFQEFGSEYVALRGEGLSHEEAWDQAGRRAGIVALFDAASFGVTGKAVDEIIKTSVMGKVKAIAGGVAADATLGMGGEAWGQLVQKGTAARVTAGELFAEGFAELVGAPAQIAAQLPGRAAELQQEAAGVSPEDLSVSPEAQSVSGEETFGRVEPEIVGTVDVAAAAGEPTLDGQAVEEQIPAQPDSLSTSVQAEPAAETLNPPPGTPPQTEAVPAPPPQEGARATSQPRSADSRRAGKESEAPRPQADDQSRADLESARSDIGWFEKGGKVIRDPDTDEVTGRTTWVPKSELWKNRPSVGGKITEDEAHVAIDKALAGTPLSAREQRWVDHVLAERTEERRRADYYADIPEAQRLDDSDFKESLLDPKEDRELAELIQRAAINATPEEVEHALEALDDDEAKRRLTALVERGRASGYAQAQPTTDETAPVSPAKEGQAAAATESRGRPTDLFGVDAERQAALNRGNREVARKLGEGRTSPPADRAPPGDLFREASEAERQDAAARQRDLERLDDEQYIGKPKLREAIERDKWQVQTKPDGTVVAAPLGTNPREEVRLNLTKEERRAYQQARADFDFADTPQGRERAKKAERSAVRTAVDRALGSVKQIESQYKAPDGYTIRRYDEGRYEEGRTSPPADRAPPGDLFREAAESQRAEAARAQTSLDDQPAAGDQEVWRVPRTVYLRGVNHSEELMTALGNTHELEVGAAVDAGKPVPADVLRDYPELKKRADLIKSGVKPLRTDQQQKLADFDRAAHEAATSPRNDLPQPTQAQKEAGNYAKGHVRVQGLDVSIENPAGSVRSGKSSDGTEWSVTMPHHYGYIRGTVGKDKDHIDVFLGPAAEDPSAPVFVYDMTKVDGTGFDEHKVMLGFRSPMEAHTALVRSYSAGVERMLDRSTAEEWTLEEFKRWLAEGDHKKKAREFTKVLNVTRPELMSESGMIRAVRRLTGLTEGSQARIIVALQDNPSDEALIRIASKAAWGGSMGGMSIEGGFIEGRNDKVIIEQNGKKITLTGKRLAALIRKAYAADVEATEEVQQRKQKAVEPAAEREPAEIWWDEQLTHAGRREIIESLGLKLPDKVKWQHLSEKNQALLRGRKIVDKTVTTPSTQRSDTSTTPKTVRYYHGGAPLDQVGKGQPIWFTTSKEDAEGWASRSPGMTVQFVDVPADHPARGEGDPEDGIPYPSRVQLPAELADKRKPLTPAKSANKVFTEDAAAKARETLRKKLGQVSSGIDPEILQAGITLAGYHIEKGARTFAAYSKAMLADLGDAVRPYLRAWYEAVRYYPGFDATGMDDASQIESRPEPARTGPAREILAAPVEEKREVAPARTKQEQVLARFGELLDEQHQMRDYRAAYAEIMGAKAEGAVTKAVDELVELAIVNKAREIVNGPGDSESKFDALVSMYNRQPNLAVRTSTSVEQQAYSTPAPLAYIAALAAGVDQRTKVGEPTAGNGMLLITARPSNAQVNELNPQRADALRSQGFKVTEKNAALEPWRHAGYPLDAVLANPPFGAVLENGFSKTFKDKWPDGTDWAGTNIDYAIAIRALAAMKDDGRATLIVGGVQKQLSSREARSDAYNGSAKRKFYYGLYRNYRVTDHFTVSGDLYTKQGAAWPVDVIVVEGRAKSTRALPAVDVPQVYSDWAALRPLVTRYATRTDDRLGAEERPTAPPPDLVRPPEPEPTPAARPTDVPDAPRRADTAAGQPVAEPAGSDRPADRPDVGRQPAARPGDGEVAGRGPATRLEQPVGRAEAPSTVSAERTEVREAAGDGGSTPSAGRGQAEPAKPTAGLGKRASVPLTEGPQQPYQPASKVPAIGTLVPANMRTALQDALEDLQRQVGDLDEYVARELKYDPKDLGRFFAAEQVDALAMAIYQFSRGSADIIGDQTGIGKGRVVAGLIRWALINKHIPIFVTEKPNLYADIYRDLVDIGQKDIRPIMTNAGESIPLDEAGNVVLTSRSSKQHNDLLLSLAMRGNLAEYNMVFTTYNQMQTVKGQRTARMEFLEGLAPKAVILTDESHNAGGQSASRVSKKDKEQGAVAGEKTGRAGFMRNILGLAVAAFHSSATWAKRPDVMDLYFRTDMLLAVEGDASKLPAAIERGGVPLQQAVAAMLTKAGQYIRRERSFAGVEYNTPIVPVDRVAAEGISEVMLSVKEFDDYKQAAVDKIKEELKAEAKALGPDNAVGAAGVTSTNFTSIMHNLIDQMLLALTADAAAESAIAALKRGEKPVVTVANTMGSFIDSYVDDVGLNSGDAIGLSFKDLMLRYLERSRDVRIKSPDGTVRRHRLTDNELGKAALDQYKRAKRLIEGKDEIAKIPVSPIDWIHNRLRQAGYKTSEITGRGQTIDYSTSPPTYRVRPGTEVSIAGRRRTIIGFNNGTIDVIVLNQAGATGLSLHASEKFKDQRRRRMIIAQAERNIDTHMQMLGRVHRTGQVIAPAFDQLVADIPAVKRPAAVLAKKMASLNANTTAARESQFTSKETLDFMNVYGDEVVAQLMEDMPEIHEQLGEPLKPEEEGLERLDAARKVTGRLPLLPVKEQEDIYELISQGYAEAIARADALGENALEAKTLQLDARVSQRNVIQEAANGSSPFADGAYADTVNVKRLGKPYTSAQVKEMVAEFTGEPATASWAQLEQKGKAMRDRLIGSVDREFRDYRQAAVDELKREEAKDSEINGEIVRLNAYFDRWNQKMRELYVGGKYEIFSEVGGTFYGVLTGIHQKKRIKNPVAGGAWVAKFAVADGMRSLTMPLSKISFQPPGSVKFFAGVFLRATTTHGLLQKPILQLFDDGQSESRENRVIVTGNLLAGFAKVSKGRIVNYTDSKGEIRQGIFLPRSFDLEEFSDEMPIDLTPSQVRELLRKQNQAVVFTSDKAVSIRYSEQGLILSVTKSKAEGGRYYLDPDLRKITGDFVSMSSSMRATLSPADAQSAMEIIAKKFDQRFIAESYKDEARMVGGTKMAARTVPVEPVDQAIELSVGTLPGPGERVLPREEVESHLAELFRHSPTQAVAIDPRNPPPKWQRVMDRIDKEFKAADTWRAAAYIDPENGKRTVLVRIGAFRSIGELERKVIHEAVHLGLRSYFGRSFELFARRTYNGQGRDTFTEVIGDYFPQGNFDERNPEHVSRAVNEWLARLGEQVATGSATARLVKLWDDFLNWLRAALRAFGVRVTFSATEIRNIVRRSAERGMRGTQERTEGDLALAIGKHTEDTKESQRAFWQWVRKGQPLDRVFRAAFTPFGAATIDRHGHWQVNPAFKAATQRAAERLSRTATRRFTWLRPMAERAQWFLEDTWGFQLKERVLHGLVDRYGTPADFIARENEKEAQVRQGLLEARALGERLMESVQTKEEAELLSAALRGEEVTDEQVRSVAAPIVDAIEDLGEQLVQAGVLTRESFERNRRKYHHRSYLRHEHVYGSPLANWVDQWSERRRVKLQGDIFRGRGIKFDVQIADLKRALPPDWWGSRYEGSKRDVRLGGTRWHVLDRTVEPTDVRQVEGLPGESQKRPRVLSRVYWPAEEPIPQRFAGYTDRGVFEVRNVTPTKILLWRDYNEAERRRMGEILDGRYNSVKTYSMMVKDLATAKFYADIAKNPEWSQSEPPRNEDGSPAWVEAREITWRRHDSYVGVDWVRVPSTKIPGSQTFRYGQLAGMYLRAAIWRDIAELEYLQLPGTWKELLKIWKVNKTARSPVVHWNNVMSNFMLMDLIDVRFSDWVKGVQSYMREDQNYQDAFRHGVFGTSNSEIDRDLKQRVLDPILRELQNEAAAGPVGRLQWLSHFFGLLKTADDWIKERYQMEDDVFRMAAYVKFLAEGQTPEEAAARARRQFIDYDIRAPWINALRTTVLPFISYTYRAIPLLAEAVYHRPWKIAKYATIGYVANAIGYALTDDEDEDRERRVMDEQYQGYTWLGTPRMVRLPFDDEYGNPAFMDVRRWMPAGDVFDMQGTTVDWMPAWLQIGGPLVLGFELGANLNTYKDEPIYDKDIDTGTEAAGKLAKHAWQGFMPNAPWIPGSYSFENLANAVTGAKTGAYQDIPTLETLIGAFGPKIRYQNTEYNIERLRNEFEATDRKLGTARNRLQREYARGRISEAELRDELIVLNEKRARAARGFVEKVNGPQE